MRSLNIEEVHDVLLNIAKAFISICDNNNIPYYMGYGTLLGAIRHKGFIPWDDDMDFCVPRPYYQELISHLEKELPYPYRCCTYKNGLNNCIILKIDDERTLIKDVCVLDEEEQNKGINIDIFPLDYVNPSSYKLKVIKILLRLNTTIYTANSDGSKWKNSLKHIVSSIFPFSRNTILSKVESMLEKVKVGDCMVNVLGIYKNKEYMPVEWFGDGVKCAFEDTEILGPKEYDKYLTQLYGDYMTPPKENKHVHMTNVFWK